MENTCFFCKVLANANAFKVQIIFEDETFLGFLDGFPVSPGHTIVFPKEHVASLLEISDNQWRQLFVTLKDTVKKIEQTNLKELYQYLLHKATDPKAKWYFEQMLAHPGIDRKADAYNFGNNDGEAAGRTVHHLHVHIIPRYIGDVDNAIGGIRTIIPRLGNYKNIEIT